MATRFQYGLLTALTALALAWLLWLTGYKEYWGFWQEPEVYGRLTKTYPEWFRNYVRDWYYANFALAAWTYAGWLTLTIRDRAPGAAKLWGLVSMTLFAGAVLGVLGANNLINWLDSGRWHGATHLPVRE